MVVHVILIYVCDVKRQLDLKCKVYVHIDNDDVISIMPPPMTDILSYLMPFRTIESIEDFLEYGELIGLKLNGLSGIAKELLKK